MQKVCTSIVKLKHIEFATTSTKQTISSLDIVTHHVISKDLWSSCIDTGYIIMCTMYVIIIEEARDLCKQAESKGEAQRQVYFCCHKSIATILYIPPDCLAVWMSAYNLKHHGNKFSEALGRESDNTCIRAVQLSLGRTVDTKTVW